MDQGLPAAAGSSADAVNIAGRLERLPLSRFHVLACALVGTAMFFDGYDIALTGLVMPSLVKVGLLAEPQRAWLISLSLLAAALGSALSGIIGDRYGRRKLIIANIVIYGLASPACGLAQSYPTLLGLRMLTMLALGMQIPAGYCYLSELVPKLHRGRMQSIVALLINGSLPAGALVAWLIVPNLPSDEGWRALFFLSALVLPLALSRPSVLPESPRWLASAGRLAEADLGAAEIEKNLRARGTVLSEPEPLPDPVQDLGWSALLTGGTRRRFALAVLFQICQLSAVFIFASWLPTILIGRGFDGASAFALSGLSFAGGALGPALAIGLSDRFERRRLLVAASCLAAVAAFAYPLHASALWLTSLGLVLTTTIYFVSATGFGIYLPEILPTGVRLRGIGVATLLGRMSSALTPFAVSGALRLVDNPLSVVGGVGLLYLLMVPAFLFLGPDTAGRSLEALEHSDLTEQQSALRSRYCLS
ncbi:MFS transporter [Bradyrhizobium erythrophlei]|uniref:MFS transporter n=1 Tax=Bradyrhizobium erythrophlei TaxID=1437360 RepID=UPI0035ED47F9